MQKIVAFIHKSTQRDRTLAETVLSLLEAPSDLLNIPQYRVEDHVKENVVIITFGKICEVSVKQHIEERKLKNVKLVPLPAVQRLQAIKGNETTREQTLQDIKDLKEFLEEDKFQPEEIIWDDGSLPNLDCKHLIMLEKMTEAAGKTSCFQTTKDGRLIEISQQKLQKSQADIHLTFHEVYTMRTIMDTLGVDEVTVVNHNKNSDS